MSETNANEVNYALQESLKIINRLRDENKRSREALEFYGNKENYKENVVDQWGPEINVMKGGGAKAAELLEGLK